LRQSRPIAGVLRGPFGLEFPEPFTRRRLGRGRRFFLLAPAEGLPLDEFRAVVRVDAQDGERERGGTGVLPILRATSLAGQAKASRPTTGVSSPGLVLKTS
jgi:hypothetical protein